MADLVQAKMQEVEARMAELERLREELASLSEAAQRLPQDDIEMKSCVCHLVQNRAAR